MLSSNLPWGKTGQITQVPQPSRDIEQKISHPVTLLRRLAGSGWGAGAKTLRTAALPLVYATTEYCAPVWCRSAHILLIDNVFNDALRIVTGYLRSTPTHHHPILSFIQPAELRRLRAILSLAKRGTLDPDHILHGQLARLPDFSQERLKPRRPFVSAARKLLNDLFKLGIRAAQWTKYRWSPEYSKRTSVLHAFIPRTTSGLLGMGLPRTSWVKRNRLRTDVGSFYSSMYKWGLAPSPNCKCGATNQTADHVISTCPIHRSTSRGGWSDGFG